MVVAWLCITVASNGLFASRLAAVCITAGCCLHHGWLLFAFTVGCCLHHGRRCVGFVVVPDPCPGQVGACSCFDGNEAWALLSAWVPCFGRIGVFLCGVAFSFARSPVRHNSLGPKHQLAQWLLNVHSVAERTFSRWVVSCVRM